MKQMILLLTTLSLCLSLCACSTDSNTPDMPETTNSTIQTTTTTAAEPKSVTVEITLDNWKDYFELREYIEFNENGFGEIDDAKIYWSIANKDEFTVDEENCNVTFEYTLEKEEVSSTIDTKTKKVIYGEVTGKNTSEATVETMNNVGQYIGEYTHDYYGEYLTRQRFEMKDGKLVSIFDYRVVDITIKRIQGTFSYFQ